MNRWRSVLFAGGVVFAMSLCFGLTAYWAMVRVKPESAAQMAALMPAISAMFGSLCLFAGAAVGFAFGKSLGEHAVKGTGLKGMVSTILTDAKPGEPEVKP